MKNSKKSRFLTLEIFSRDRKKRGNKIIKAICLRKD